MDRTADGSYQGGRLALQSTRIVLRLINKNFNSRRLGAPPSFLLFSQKEETGDVSGESFFRASLSERKSRKGLKRNSPIRLL
jgi:hypothetical protein